MSPLRGIYLIQNRWARRLMRCVDFFLKLLIFHRREFPIVELPQKILVCNIANLGDVVISTAALRAIKRKYPDAKIGFLAASKSETAAKNHPLIDFVHVFDHWYQKPSLRAIVTHLKTERRALREIRAHSYDAAIDLHPYFPNAVPLLYNTRIPVRIGYSSGGFSPLLTHSYPFADPGRYIGHAFLRLLTPFGVRSEFETPLPFYPIARKDSIVAEPYIVIHMGTSSPLKEWPVELWKELVRRLSGLGHRLVFTGQGEKEARAVKSVCSAATTGIDLTNRLNWIEFSQVIQQAKLLISVDSASIHLAAAASVPTVALFCGIADLRMWLPPYSRAKGMIESVPCAPCFNKRGCDSMACIRQISIDAVLETAKAFL